MKEYAFIYEEGKLPDVLKKVSFLESFSPDDLNDVLTSSCLVQCDEGDTLLKQGAEGSRMYILLAGDAEIIIDGERIAEYTQTGDIFGELAILRDEHRSATVVAKTNSLFLAIDQKFLRDIKPEQQNAPFYAALYGFLTRLMAERLRITSEELAHVEQELEKCQRAAKA